MRRCVPRQVSGTVRAVVGGLDGDGVPVAVELAVGDMLGVHELMDTAVDVQPEMRFDALRAG